MEKDYGGDYDSLIAGECDSLICFDKKLVGLCSLFSKARFHLTKWLFDVPELVKILGET